MNGVKKSTIYEGSIECKQKFDSFRSDYPDKLDIGSLVYFIKEDNNEINIISKLDYEFIGGCKAINLKNVNME